MLRPMTWMAIASLFASWGCDGPGRDAYRGLRVPEATLGSSEARDRGRELFVRNCALCHGEAADGRGERRSALSTPAADFTSRSWRERATPRSTFVAIREGVRGTAMPAWRQFTDDEVWSLVAYLLARASQDR